MGTKCAPTYATLSLGYLEVLLYEKLRHASESFAMFFKRNWKRYPNDRFIMWTKSLSDLHDFHQLLNQLEPSIQYEMKYSQCELEFLDLKVLQNDGKISLDIYTTRIQILISMCHSIHVTHGTLRQISHIMKQEGSVQL